MNKYKFKKHYGNNLFQKVLIEKYMENYRHEETIKYLDDFGKNFDEFILRNIIKGGEQ